jgi:hypothetical protein
MTFLDELIESAASYTRPPAEKPYLIWDNLDELGRRGTWVHIRDGIVLPGAGCYNMPYLL